ncbi:hypothetical protein FG379_003225 [Cryptosporidium bovis]|uniref:uncharacterized protein n=1 Tax=Cryptosporidium bovis TaxID=310047 RepID=UPI00351A2C4B|nr:hypothetical protein FG379_003225 [Cryptosporidium bovis]
MYDIPLRTYCMAFGYDGTEYHGMQIQMRNNKKVEEIGTIEGEMESCLEKLDIFYVNEDLNKCRNKRSKLDEDVVAEANFLKKIRWSRVGRTDKGVHSACQVVSFRAKIRVNDELLSLIEKKNENEETKELINKLLIERDTLNREVEINEDQINRNDINSKGRKGSKSGKKLESNPLLSFNNNNNSEAEGVDNKASLSDEFANELIILDYIMNKMNELLVDKKISVFKIIRVTKNFDARTDCSRRQYEYILPEYLLYPVTITDLELKNELENVCEERYQRELIELNNNNEKRKREKSFSKTDIVSNCNECDEVENKDEKMKIFEFHQLNRQNNYGFGNNKKLVDYLNINNSNNLNVLLDYKIDNDKLSEFQSILNEYVGTHSFHNFTSKSSYYDSNSWRHIENIKVEFTDISSNSSGNKTNAIKVIIKGQSFMLHQIRKMIALAIEVFRGTAPKNAIQLSFLPNKLSIHLSPSQGLLLDRVSYSTYNIKRSISTEKKDFNVHFISFDNEKCLFVKKIEHFKRDFIYKRIYETIIKKYYPHKQENKKLENDHEEAEYDNNK